MIRRFQHVSARTKILLFAFLFIILPSGILGYLGFRSIGNRGLALKENYRSMARLMRDELASEFSNLEGRFLGDALDRDWSGNLESNRALLAGILERNPAVGDTFIVDFEGSVVHPDFILDRKGTAPAGGKDFRPPRNPFIKEGERLEFAELDYPTAARSYREAVRQAPSPDVRLYARLLLGRCYFKMKDYARAGEQYRILAEQGREAKSSDGTPLRVIGLFRLAESYAARGENDRGIQALLDLFEELSLGPGRFESRNFYLESIRADLERIFRERSIHEVDRDRWEILKAEDRARIEKLRRMEGIRQDLLARVDTDAVASEKDDPLSRTDTVSPSHLTIPDDDGIPLRIGYKVLPSGTVQDGKRLLVYELDKTYVVKEVFPRLANSKENDESVLPALTDPTGPLTPLPDSPGLSQTLAVESLTDYFPGWSLALFDTRGKSIDQIVRREMRWYGALFLGIAVLIVSGIVMTLRAATHEAETVRLRSDFVSNISHELKTPLSLIRLFGETLESDERTDEAKRREFSRIIARESRRLSHLIDNVLDFSKIDSGRKEYSFENGDLVELVSDTVDAYRFYLRDQGFEFDVSLPHEPLIASMDRDALAQALLNLLSNAEKYSGERKYIGVRMFLEGDRIAISVEDKGPGIPQPELRHIFEKFYRGGKGPSREVQGCGLGLTIVKSTVDSHGGQVRVESEPGRGSRFTITLPRGDRMNQSPGPLE